MQVKLKVKSGGSDFWERLANTAKDGTLKPEVEYLPGAGNHFFTY